MNKKNIILISVTVVFTLLLSFIYFMILENSTSNDLVIDGIEGRKPTLSSSPLENQQDYLVDTSEQPSKETSSMSPNMGMDWMNELIAVQRPLDEIETFLSGVHKYIVLQPMPKLSALKTIESDEVRAYLDTSRQNYEQIQNIHISFSSKLDGSEYFLEGEIAAKINSGKYDHMTSDFNTSSGGRFSYLYTKGLLLYGQGGGIKEVTDNPCLPADPMFHDVFRREYKLLENGNEIADPNVVRLQSIHKEKEQAIYTLWIDKNTKSLLRYKSQLAEGISREMIITKYKTYPDGLYYPEEMIIKETLNDDTLAFKYFFTDVVINP